METSFLLNKFDTRIYLTSERFHDEVISLLYIIIKKISWKVHFYLLTIFSPLE